MLPLGIFYPTSVFGALAKMVCTVSSCKPCRTSYLDALRRVLLSRRKCYSSQTTPDDDGAEQQEQVVPYRRQRTSPAKLGASATVPVQSQTDMLSGGSTGMNIESGRKGFAIFEAHERQIAAERLSCSNAKSYRAPSNTSKPL
jgi:hypothetical protein